MRPGDPWVPFASRYIDTAELLHAIEERSAAWRCDSRWPEAFRDALARELESLARLIRLEVDECEKIDELYRQLAAEYRLPEHERARVRELEELARRLDPYRPPPDWYSKAGECSAEITEADRIADVADE